MTEPWDVPMTIKCQFSQEADSCDSGGDQTLDVWLEDAGGGNFLVFKTERWALDADEIDRLADMLRRVLAGRTGVRDYFTEVNGPKEAT